MRRVRRILAIKNRAIGDTILLTGPLRQLKARFPDHQIDILVRSPAGELLEGLPFVDRVISATEPKGKMERFAYWLRMVRRLRESRYEMVLNFHASFRTAFTAKLFRSAQCIANHHELKGRNWFSDLPVPGRGKVKPIIDRDLDILRALGIVVDVADAMPEIRLNDLEREQALQKLKGGSNQPSKGKFLFLGFGAGRETKKYPPDLLADLVLKLSRLFSDCVFITASIQSDEASVALFEERIQSHPELSKRYFRFKNLRLRETAALMSHCHGYVGNDSGLKHLAVALKLPTYTFFGPESPLEWHPYPLEKHPLGYIDDLACRTEAGKHWCAIESCKVHEHQCMRKITPEKASESIVQLLKSRGF